MLRNNHSLGINQTHRFDETRFGSKHQVGGYILMGNPKASFPDTCFLGISQSHRTQTVKSSQWHLRLMNLKTILFWRLFLFRCPFVFILSTLILLVFGTFRHCLGLFGCAVIWVPSDVGSPTEACRLSDS